jgi:tetratricopeptide (TPR) repeat protein
MNGSSSTAVHDQDSKRNTREHKEAFPLAVAESKNATCSPRCGNNTPSRQRLFEPLRLGSLRRRPNNVKVSNKKNVSSYWVDTMGSSFVSTEQFYENKMFEKSNRPMDLGGYWNSIKYLTSKSWRKRLSSSKSNGQGSCSSDKMGKHGDNQEEAYEFGFHDNDDEDEEDSFVDPLAVVIEKARRATVHQRVRLVRFNLDQNEILDDSILEHQEKEKCDCKDSSRRPSILLNATGKELSWNHCTSSRIKEYVDSVMMDDSASRKSTFDNGRKNLIAASSLSSSSSSCSNAVSNNNTSSPLLPNFEQEPKISNQIQSLLDKGRNYHTRYEFSKAAKIYLQALKKLNRYSYPAQHPLQQSVQQAIHEIHHAHQNLEHSTNIVKIGINLESKGKLVKALKMYTVALRIRKESLGIQHPSIPMLLNLLGSVQVKRGQYEDAMEIFELALYEKKTLQDDHGESVHVLQRKNASMSTLAVSMREIGSIHEHFGRLDKAMVMYHQSLDCLMQNPRIVQIRQCWDDVDKERRGSVRAEKYGRNTSGGDDCSTESESLDVCVVNAVSTSCSTNDSLEEMEIYLQESLSYDSNHVMRNIANLGLFYDSFFQRREVKAKHLALCVASILHCIAKVHHQQQEYNLAASSYHASLRGMKIVHGEKHQTIAAILVNIGNLLKDTKDYERAHDLFQSALKIESLRLGYSHPNVLVSMLNIASVESCRGRYDESIALYKEIIKIHRSRHQGNTSTANLLLDTHCLLGDIYEKNGNLNDAIVCYKEALEVAKTTLPSLQSDTGKLLHKLGILCSNNGQFTDADKYFMEALELYENGSIMDERIVQVERDKADNRGNVFKLLISSTR